MTSDFGVMPQPPASLTVEPDRFSDDAWELLLCAQDCARRWRHGDLDVEHLIQALFTDPRFQAEVDPLALPRDQLLDQLEGFLAEQPMARADELFVGEDLETLLEEADRVRGLWGSRLIALSHLLIAIGRDPRIGRTFSRVLACPLTVSRLSCVARSRRPPSVVLSPSRWLALRRQSRSPPRCRPQPWSLLRSPPPLIRLQAGVSGSRQPMRWSLSPPLNRNRRLWIAMAGTSPPQRPRDGWTPWSVAMPKSAA